MLDFPRRRKARAQDLATYTRLLNAMVNAGAPFLGSLEALSREPELYRISGQLSRVARDIESGSTLSDAMSKQATVFDDCYVTMVATGEAGGILDVALSHLGGQLDSALALEERIERRITLPSLAASGALLLAGLLAFVVLFALALPGAVPAFACICLAAAVTFAIGVNERRHLARRMALVRFARSLGSLLHLGAPILMALDAVRQCEREAGISGATLAAKRAVEGGGPIAAALRMTGACPLSVILMIEAGEETGALDSTLEKVASLYEREVDAAIAARGGRVSRILMGALSVLGLAVVGAIYLVARH